MLLEFRARDLSAAGAFIATDDLFLLDLDEEVEVLVGTCGGPFAAAPGRVTCSTRSFASGSELTASGFRLEFLDPCAGFRAAVDGPLRAVAARTLPETGLEPARSVRTKGF